VVGGIGGYIPLYILELNKIKIDRYIRVNHLYILNIMASIYGRNNQQERGLSVNQDKILPKLTSEQRKTMTEEEKKAYNAKRLKQYRTEYINMYSKEVVAKGRAEKRQEKKDALVFYQQFKAQQAQIAV